MPAYWGKRGGSGPRQARLSRALDGIDVRPLDEALGRAAGVLLGSTGLADVIDAAVVLISSDGDDIVTLDRDDFERLAAASERHVGSSVPDRRVEASDRWVPLVPDTKSPWPRSQVNFDTQRPRGGPGSPAP